MSKSIDSNEWANLTLMNDEDIDYRALPEDVLKTLPLGSELYIATSALVELWMRESSVAAPIAWEILSTSHGDRYLQATALTILFDIDREKAVNYMTERVQDCDPFVLNKMMKLLVENPTDFIPGSVIIRIILERLKNLDDEQELVDPDVKDSFFKRYSHLKSPVGL